MDWTELSLDFNEDNQATFGPCDCCGNMTSRVWGYVYRGEEAIAAYFVEWTPGHKERAANFDFIIGKWGEASTALDRQATSLSYRVSDNGPAFMVIDAITRSVGSNPLVSHALLRSEVIGMPVAAEVFAISDAIYVNDPRITQLRP